MKAKLDAVFSKYIRARDSIDGKYCKCVTCGDVHRLEIMDCGHYFSRAHMGTRYEEANCHAQCIHCNRFLCGNIEKYTEFMLSSYGEEVIDLLRKKKNNPTHMTRLDYYLMIAYYKEKLQDLTHTI